ncbi:29306_t:CDS:10 [Racocetra persica]|uniref:29306_t:CDS:1 n=1 Tax=Racocetra persica TaxID=160502 RepID=A0ACA9KP99_9GLOM|nr:29306_t:CDS:10 [Racocetra persica]
MTENSNNDIVPPVVSSNTSTSKTSSPAALKDHLGNLCNNVPLDIRDLFLNWLAAKALDFNISKSKKRKLGNQSNQAQLSDFIETLVKAFVVCGILFHIIQNSFFIELLKTLHPAYEPPSKNILSDRYLAQETAFANQAVIKKLNSSKNLTIACDGWSNPSSDSIWNFVVYTPDPACHIIAKQYPNILNLRCISHAVNLILKDICKTPFANRMLTRCNTVVSYFKRNHLAGNTLKILAEENLVEGGGLKRWIRNSDNVNVSVQSILRTRAFFDDLNTLAFVLRPIKLAISIFESQNCSLANCFIGLVHLGAAIRRLLENDYHSFWQQAITIFNRRFAEFDDDAYILCFFLHPGYTGTFRRILLAADSFYEKIVWWISLEDYFLKDEDHICQLAHMLLSITPHAARYKRIWFTLGWYYGKCYTCLSLDKIENMQKLSAFYLANLKNELPYFASNIENLYEALLANEERPLNEERPSNEEIPLNKKRPANEGKPGNKERPANEEPTNEKTEDTFIPL